MLYKGIVKYYSPMGESAMPILTMENCEPFLLLYIDGELTAGETKLVDKFIQQEPEANELLLALKATILEIDDVTADKIALYQTAAISDVNFEEKALMAIDNELNALDIRALTQYMETDAVAALKFAQLQKTKLPKENIGIDKLQLQKHTIVGYAAPVSAAALLLSQLDKEHDAMQSSAVASLLTTNSELGAAYRLLQKTKLSQETITHPNKESLYKKEKDKVPIVPIWLRYAAAASVVLGGLWMIVSNRKTNEVVTPNVVKVTPIPANPKAAIDTNIHVPQTTEVATTAINNSATKSEVVKNELTQKNIVTKNNTPRITNTNDDNKTVLTNNTDEQSLAISNTVTNVSAITGNETQSTATIAQPSASKMPKQTIQVSYITTKQVTEDESNVSIVGVPLEKIDKKNKTGKLKQKLTSLLAKAKYELSNREISIAGYDIALSNKNAR